MEYDSKPFMEDASKCKLIKEIESTKFNLIIDGKTYRTCAGSPKEGILAVEEINFIVIQKLM
ncbi:hypothetical protein NSQ40_19225 [Bacillus sp. FSL K6-6038]|uniref:hypothetical protein n=1 Tax=Bacillus sp. FSL K6-6038 TaxID=2954615 RepID=UPI0031013ACE